MFISSMAKASAPFAERIRSDDPTRRIVISSGIEHRLYMSEGEAHELVRSLNEALAGITVVSGQAVRYTSTAG